MAIKVLQVEMFQTSDGKKWESRHEANVHEAKLEVDRIMSKTGAGRGGYWDEDMITRALIENAAELGAALTQLAVAQAALKAAALLDRGEDD